VGTSKRFTTTVQNPPKKPSEYLLLKYQILIYLECVYTSAERHVRIFLFRNLAGLHEKIFHRESNTSMSLFILKSNTKWFKFQAFPERNRTPSDAVDKMALCNNGRNKRMGWYRFAGINKHKLLLRTVKSAWICLNCFLVLLRDEKAAAAAARQSAPYMCSAEGCRANSAHAHYSNIPTFYVFFFTLTKLAELPGSEVGSTRREAESASDSREGC
jgi:hypothetical protein